MAAKCNAKTKKGTSCSRNAVTGLKVCIAHAPDDFKVSQGFGGKQPGAGRPPAPRAVDVLRERIEQDIDKVVDGLWAALEAETLVWAGDRDAETVPDHKVRLAAIRELLDRGYGKPKQTQEITSPDGSLPVLVLPADQLEKSRKAAALLKNIGQLPDAG